MGLKQAKWFEKVDRVRPLAEFANLSEEGVAAFRQKRSEFVPQAWWDYQSDIAANAGKKHWQLIQSWLRDAWEQWGDFYLDLSLPDLLPLLTSIFDPKNLSRLSTARTLRPACSDPMDLREWSETGVLEDGMYPYQQAVLFLNKEPWRAKTCGRKECGKFFVANSPRQEYCGVDCSGIVHRATKRQTWADHGRKYRAAQRRRLRKRRKTA
jgi:hypothetical protein